MKDQEKIINVAGIQVTKEQLKRVDKHIDHLYEYLQPYSLGESYIAMMSLMCSSINELPVEKEIKKSFVAHLCWSFFSICVETLDLSDQFVDEDFQKMFNSWINKD